MTKETCSISLTPMIKSSLISWKSSTLNQYVCWFKNTDTTSWIGEHVLISVSISSNLIEQPCIFCNSHPRASVECFLDALDGLATKSKAQKGLKFLEIETSWKSKHNQIFSALNHRRCRTEPVLEFRDGCIEEEEEEEQEEEEEEEEEEEQDVWTQFLQNKRINSLIFRITGKKIATYFQVLASTVQITTLI